MIKLNFVSHMEINISEMFSFNFQLPKFSSNNRLERNGITLYCEY